MILSKLIRLGIQLALLVVIAMAVYWWLGTTRYGPGEKASGLMPVVLHVVGTNPPRYELVHPRALAETLVAHPSFSLTLPEPAGSFSLPPEKSDFTPTVSFQVTALEQGQRVLVKHRTDDYNFEGQYVTSGALFQPERFFAGHAMSALLAVIVGLIGAKGLSWLHQRFWRVARSTPRNGGGNPQP